MHLCRNLQVIGVHVDGGFAEHVVIPEANAIESNGLDPAVVALQEPMGNAVHAAFVEPIEGRKRGRHRLRADRPVRGRHRQGRRRRAGDRHRHRAVPAGAGADAWAPTLRSTRDAATEERIAEATGGDGVEVVLEMSGAAPAWHQALRVVTRGGPISLLGIFSEPPQVDLSDLVIMKGVRCTASTGGASTTRGSEPRPCCAARLDVSPIITHRLDLADWEQGFDLIASRHAGKVVLTAMTDSRA